MRTFFFKKDLKDFFFKNELKSSHTIVQIIHILAEAMRIRQNLCIFVLK